MFKKNHKKNVISRPISRLKKFLDIVTHRSLSSQTFPGVPPPASSPTPDNQAGPSTVVVEVESSVLALDDTAEKQVPEVSRCKEETQTGNFMIDLAIIVNTDPEAPHSIHTAFNSVRIISVSGSEEREITLILERVAPAIWRYHGRVEMTSDIDGLKIIARPESGDDVGETFLQVDELEDLKGDAPQNIQVKRELETEAGSPAMRISLRIGAVPVEEVTEQMNAKVLRMHGDPVPSALHKWLDAPAQLNSMACQSTRRFQRTGAPSELSDAISALKKAVKLTAKGHSDLPVLLNNLGDVLVCRFEQTGELEDLSRGLSVIEKAGLLTSKVRTAVHSSGQTDGQKQANQVARRFHISPLRRVQLAKNGFAPMDNWLLA